VLEFLAERKIAEAIANGELDNLPGEGRPLDLEDDALVPEDLRLAYRILKNAGFVPAELDALKQIEQLEALVNRSDADAATRSRAVRKLALLRTRIETAYYGRAIDRLSR
jgi:hypothetical protein